MSMAGGAGDGYGTERAVTLRLAQARDAATIHRLIQDLARSLGAPEQVSSTPQDFQRAAAADRADFIALLAERDAQAVGLCLYFYSFSTWRGRRGVYVQDIYVADSERGTGLGRRLMAETARRAAAEGASYLRLAVDRENHAAQDFYRSVGMEHASREHIFMARGAAFEALQQMDRPTDKPGYKGCK